MTVDHDTGEVLVAVGVAVESNTHLDADGYLISGIVIDDTQRAGADQAVPCYLTVRVYRRRIEFHTIDVDDAQVLSGAIRKDVVRDTMRFCGDAIAKGDTDPRLIRALNRLQAVLE